MSIEKKTQNCSTASEDDDRIRETSNATSKHSAPATDLKSKQRQPFEHHHPDWNEEQQRSSFSHLCPGFLLQAANCSKYPTSDAPSQSIPQFRQWRRVMACCVSTSRVDSVTIRSYRNLLTMYTKDEVINHPESGRMRMLLTPVKIFYLCCTRKTIPQ